MRQAGNGKNLTYGVDTASGGGKGGVTIFPVYCEMLDRCKIGPE